MTDRLDREQRSANMRAIRAKGMKPEMIVRRLVHGMGYRYRLHRKDLPGTPDLVFGPRRKVIFVHGCFWHQHSDPSCKISHTPRTRLDYWQPKLRRNQERDAANQSALHGQGWQVLTIWECETQPNCQSRLTERLRSFLDS